MQTPLLPPAPLGARPLGRRAIALLIADVRAAINRWPGRYDNGAARSCRLCGALGGTRRAARLDSDDLCRRCRRAPLDTRQAADALAELGDRLDLMNGGAE